MGIPRFRTLARLRPIRRRGRSPRASPGPSRDRSRRRSPASAARARPWSRSRAGPSRRPSSIARSPSSAMPAASSAPRQMTRELEATRRADPPAAALLAYELGELYERRLADEARAVKAYGRALNLDPSLRPNLWAIRRVFYRRGLWPNLVKLIDAEVAYARDDYERADLLLEKARVCAHQMDDPGEARTALDEAVRIAPQHQGALLELERVVARAGDVRRAARRLGAARRGGRAARAQDRLLARGRPRRRGRDRRWRARRTRSTRPRRSRPAARGAGERIARERLRLAEETRHARATSPRRSRRSRPCCSRVRPGGTGRTGGGDHVGRASGRSRDRAARASWSRCAAARPSSPAASAPSARGTCCSRRSRCRPASRSCSPI